VKVHNVASWLHDLVAYADDPQCEEDPEVKGAVNKPYFVVTDTYGNRFKVCVTKLRSDDVSEDTSSVLDEDLQPLIEDEDVAEVLRMLAIERGM
jgi:hypothetical protein